jgi:hypothetical protein
MANDSDNTWRPKRKGKVKHRCNANKRKLQKYKMLEMGRQRKVRTARTNVQTPRWGRVGQSRSPKDHAPNVCSKSDGGMATRVSSRWASVDKGE